MEAKTTIERILERLFSRPEIKPDYIVPNKNKSGRERK